MLMNTETPNLQIRVHKLDRSISSFVQNDFEISRRILGGFDPMNIFTRPRIILGDKDSQTVIPVSQITRIDLEMNQDSPLSFVTDLVQAVELMPAEFEALVQNLAHDHWNHLGEMDAVVVTFLDLEMADGRNVLLTMEVDSVSPQGLSELRDFLLSRPGLCFRAGSGGVSVLNLANLSCLTIFPGAHQPADDVWHVQRCGDKQPVNRDDNFIPEIASGPCPPPASSVPSRGLRIKRV
jgi:hypothetical protein